MRSPTENKRRYASTLVATYVANTLDLTEKMTDVALGVEMVSDVLRGEVEGLVLITRDVD